MKQAINIRLEKDVIDALDEYASELDKSWNQYIKSPLPRKRVTHKREVHL